MNTVRQLRRFTRVHRTDRWWQEPSIWILIIGIVMVGALGAFTVTGIAGTRYLEERDEVHFVSQEGPGIYKTIEDGLHELEQPRH